MSDEQAVEDVRQLALRKGVTLNRDGNGWSMSEGVEGEVATVGTKPQPMSLEQIKGALNGLPDLPEQPTKLGE